MHRGEAPEASTSTEDSSGSSDDSLDDQLRRQDATLGIVSSPKTVRALEEAAVSRPRADESAPRPSERASGYGGGSGPSQEAVRSERRVEGRGKAPETPRMATSSGPTPGSRGFQPGGASGHPSPAVSCLSDAQGCSPSVVSYSSLSLLCLAFLVFNVAVVEA